jgi:hypothetical protein
MITTKLLTLEVICESCNTEEHIPFCKNHDDLTCDKCGQIKKKVTFEAVGKGGLRDENSTSINT